MITAGQLATAAGCRIERATKWLPYFETTFDRFDINTPQRIAAFIAQVAHESARLSVVEENLNYSAQGLLLTFPKYFDAIRAAQYARTPEAIANIVYSNRMGNGAPESGDGWKYRGRGLIQITGKANYADCGSDFGVDLVNTPDLLLTMDYASLSAGWFWMHKGCNELADQGDFLAIIQKINGGLNGKDERFALWGAAKSAIC